MSAEDRVLRAARRLREGRLRWELEAYVDVVGMWGAGPCRWFAGNRSDEARRIARELVLPGVRDWMETPIRVRLEYWRAAVLLMRSVAVGIGVSESEPWVREVAFAIVKRARPWTGYFRGTMASTTILGTVGVYLTVLQALWEDEGLVEIVRERIR